MTKKRPEVHPKVYDLAAYFLVGAHESEIWALAEAIQAACDDVREALEDRLGREKGK